MLFRKRRIVQFFVKNKNVYYREKKNIENLENFRTFSLITQKIKIIRDSRDGCLSISFKISFTYMYFAENKFEFILLHLLSFFSRVKQRVKAYHLSFFPFSFRILHLAEFALVCAILATLTNLLLQLDHPRRDVLLPLATLLASRFASRDIYC